MFNVSRKMLDSIAKIPRPGDLHSAVIRADPQRNMTRQEEAEMWNRYEAEQLGITLFQQRLARLAAFQSRADRARKLKPRKRYEEL